MKHTLLIAALVGAGTFLSTPLVQAQVAGTSTTVGVNVTETTQLAMGWSVRRAVLGKTVFNDKGEKIGKVEDLIVAPDRNVSYVIIGAGGFVGIGRHDVAVPVSGIRSEAGKLVMAGATRDLLKALPAFEYTSDTALRGQFVATAEKDLALARGQYAALRQKAATASTEARARLDVDIAMVEIDMKAAEAKLSELKRATANRWRELEAGVNAANARLHKSIEKAMA